MKEPSEAETWVREAVTAMIGTQSAEQWLLTQNPHLSNRSPLDFLRMGDTEPVLAYVRSLLDGRTFRSSSARFEVN